MTRTLKIFVVIMGICFMLVMAHINYQNSFAQSNDDEWSPPANISQSGGTTDPTLVIDSRGVFHAIWKDIYAGFVYASGDGQTWSKPRTVVFPFSDNETAPYLVANLEGKIHALWIDENNNLLYSQVSAEEITNPASWTPPLLLTRSVLDLDVVIDNNNNLHLAYVRTASENEYIPAGIYYQHFLDDTVNWTEVVPIDQSPYLRGITQVEAHVDLATATHDDLTTVYIAWDNRSRGQIFVAQSIDTGNTWDDPMQIEQQPTSFNIPYEIQIEAYGNRALLLWKYGNPGENCTQHYLSTSDNGQLWGDRNILFGQQDGCPQESHLNVTDQGQFILFTILNSQAYLIAWDGLKWSNPQPQREFTNLQDPDTGRFIDFQCLQTTIESEISYIIGCDPTISGDIWFTAREINDIDTWYPSPSRWSDPAAIVSGADKLSSPLLLSDSKGRLHALWNQVSSSSGGLIASIVYSRWDGDHWLIPNTIIQLQNRDAILADAIIDSNDRLLIVWRMGKSGGLYLSGVDVDLAAFASEWVTFEQLPTIQNYARSPDIHIDNNGIIYIAYAIPLNEDRGIYILSSNDGGFSWSDPIQIVNATEFLWEMVDLPRITHTTNGDLHLLWTRFTLPDEADPIALYYSGSQDMGQSWSDPELIIEQSIIWSNILGSQENMVHILWQSSIGSSNFIWHQISSDSGKTWNNQENISILNTNSGSADLFFDPSDRLNFTQIMEETPSKAYLRHWIYENDHWEAQENLSLENNMTFTEETPSGVVSESGTIGTIFVGITKTNTSDNPTYALLFSNRLINLPPRPIETNSVLTESPNTTIISTPTNEFSQTSTPTTPIQSPTTTPSSPAISTPSNPEPQKTWINYFVGGVIPLLIIIIIIGYRFIRSRATNN